MFYVFAFSFPPGVYVGALNIIASIPGPSILTFHVDYPNQHRPQNSRECIHTGAITLCVCVLSIPSDGEVSYRATSKF